MTEKEIKKYIDEVFWDIQRPYWEIHKGSKVLVMTKGKELGVVLKKDKVYFEDREYNFTEDLRIQEEIELLPHKYLPPKINLQESRPENEEDDILWDENPVHIIISLGPDEISKVKEILNLKINGRIFVDKDFGGLNIIENYVGSKSN